MGCLGVAFFGAIKDRRVHRKRVARIKHGGGRAMIVTGEKEKLRENGIR